VGQALCDKQTKPEPATERHAWINAAWGRKRPKTTREMDNKDFGGQEKRVTGDSKIW